MGKTAQELYQEREQRIMNAIHLEPVDRIPVMLAPTYFPAKYAGTTFKDAWYDQDKWLEATRKTIVDFAPDGIWSIQGFNPGAALEYLEPKTQKWPGWGLADDNMHQAIEIESMKGSEYDLYFNDKSDFVFRTMFGRMIGAAEPFKKLPPLASMTSTFAALSLAEALADPEVAAAIEKFQKAGRIYKEMRPKLVNFYQVAESLGFPCPTAPGGGAPFDGISDWMRGMQGAMTDMYRYPDKLHRMVDEFLQRTLAMLDTVPVFTKPARALMPLHRGSDGFMSLKQFEEFYWPGLKAIMLKMIDKGITPCPFLEGTWDQRLKYLLELPKGKVLAHFAYSDMKKAKDVLGGHLCIMNSVPSSLLNTGTAQQVEEYVKDLLKYCAKGGGFIVANNTINEGKPECVRAMIETVKKYGARYL
jgi:uroporphyrinogen-III decarboxylase